MKLFNKTIDRQLFKQYPLGSDLSKQEVVVKIFNPYGNGTWFILNSDPEDPEYLWAIVDLGYGAEVGSVGRSELENYRNRMGWGFERDLSFDPVNALELYQGLNRGEFYAKGGGVGSSEENTFDKIFLHYGFTKKRGAYGVRPYEHKKLGTYAQIDDKTRSIQIETPDDEYKGGYSVKGVIEFLKSKGFEETGSYDDGGNLSRDRKYFNHSQKWEVAYSKGKGRKGYGGLSFSDGGGVDVESIEEEIRSLNSRIKSLSEINTKEASEEVKKLVQSRSALQARLLHIQDSYADGGGVQSKIQIKNFADLKQGDVIRRKDKLGTTIFVVNRSPVQSRSYKNEYDALVTCIVSNTDYYKPYEEYYITSVIRYGKLGNVDYIGKRNYNDGFDYSIYLPKSNKKFADGGDISDFSDNQRMIMNQNVEVEHHHEELEDILEDVVPVPAWVVAKMETATQNLSDITHYLDGQKEIMKDKLEGDDDDDDDDDDEIENKEVVEPINVSAGTKAEITKKFTDDAWGNLRGFLKGMEGIDLRDDYTFDYRDEQFEVEPIINSDENGVSNAVFSIFDGDGEEVGEVAYSREGGKQKFTANSDYFQWNNAKFEDGGYFDGTIPSVSSYMSTYVDGGFIELNKKSEMPQEFELVEWSLNGRTSSFKGRMYFQKGTGYMFIEKENGDIYEPKSNNKLYWRKIKEYAKGGEVAKAEVLGLSKNIMGTTDIEMKISGMRKSQDFIVYPISADDTDKIITIQSSTRIGKIDLSTGRGLMSQSHSNGAYFVHFQMDKLTPFTVSESDLEDIKAHIFRTAGANVGTRGIVSDNSGASRLFAHGGGIGFIPMDLEETLRITAKWGGTNIKGVIGILNAMIDSGLTDEDLKPKPTKSGTAHQNAIEKKTNEIWVKIEPQYKGDLKGNMPYSTIRRLVDRANSSDDVLKRFKPFRKNQKDSFADGGFMNDVYADGGQIRVGDRFKYDWTDGRTGGEKGYNVVEVIKNNVTSSRDFKTKVMVLKIIESSEPSHVGRIEEDYKPSFKKAIRLGMIKPLQERKSKMVDEFYAMGGMSKFEKLSNKVAKQYEGKPVKSEYQDEYGKVYSKEEAKEVGDKVAGKMKAMTADKKAFGGLFGGAKKFITPSKKYPNIVGKQGLLKSGQYVQVFEQNDNKISVLELNKMGSGVRPHYIDISEVEIDSFKAGGKIAGKRVNGGTETLKRANELAKEIRKDGESWLDAKKRAFAQLKK